MYMMCLSSHANHHSVATITHVSRLSNRLFKQALILTTTAPKAHFLASKITALSEVSSTCRSTTAEEDGGDRSLDCRQTDRQRQRDRDRETERQRQTDRQTETETERRRQKDRHRETETDTHTETGQKETDKDRRQRKKQKDLSLIHISEPTRRA